MKVGALFAGVGGIELGLSRANKEARLAWAVELEPFPRAVLASRFPDAKLYKDVKEVNWNEVEKVDVLTGGFPCQDISFAGKNKGIKQGTRSGLWFEFKKAISVLRPRIVIIENVAALLGRGLDIVLSDLAEIGYDARWDCLPAASVGAPHRRDRIFIFAHSNSYSDGCGEHSEFTQGDQGKSDEGSEFAELRSNVADSNKLRSERCKPSERRCRKPETQTARRSNLAEFKNTVGQVQWQVEPSIHRVVDGVPFGMDSAYYSELVTSVGRKEAEKISRWVWKERIKACGNGVVPQCVEFVLKGGDK